MNEIDIAMEDRMDTDIYLPIYEFVTQVLMNPWMVNSISLDIWEGENADIYITEDYIDIVVDIEDNQWNELDWGWWCNMEDWNPIRDTIYKQWYLTKDQRDEMNRMIIAKSQWLYELCFTR